MRKTTAAFLIAEGALWCAFLTLDLLGIPGPGVWLKYAGVLLCLAFALGCARQGGEVLPAAALVLTALADSLLLVADSHYALGVLIFLGAQSVYLVRLRLATGRSWTGLRLAFPLAAGLAMYGLGQASGLNLLAGLYFSQLAVNTALSWTLKGRKWRRFAVGLTLFVCCDICVGAFNSPGLVPAGAYAFARVGMWLCYLPSQALIALSALPEKGTGDETK